MPGRKSVSMAHSPTKEGACPGQPLAGTLGILVLFFDFGIVYPTNHTYYFDDVFMQGVAPPPALGDITFSLDMSDFPGTFTTPFVSGTFNAWSQFGNPLTDPDGDNIWTATVLDIPFGNIEYKFQLDGWQQEETFTPGDPCTVTNFGFTNRVYDVNGDAMLATVCWNSCFSCFKVPTMSEWGVFLLALLMISAGAVFIVGFEKQTALATSGGNQSVIGSVKPIPFQQGKLPVFHETCHWFGPCWFCGDIYWMGRDCSR